MFYTNISFLILFISITIAVRLLPFAFRKYILIAVSLLVIATWGWASLIIFVLTLLVAFVFADFLSAHRLPNYQHLSRGNILGIAIVFNILLLVLFKYRSFLFGHHLVSFLDGPLTQIGIPLGISFYSFHIISYLVDLYKGKYQRASFSDFLFYLSFFPHVIAGPIVRGWQLIPQIKRQRNLKNDLLFGSHLFITGFFLKTVCADNIGAVIDPYWQTQSPELGILGHWWIAMYYYFQLYGDFAGYSLMACGMARLLGYRLPANFRLPMRAVGFQDFWRRWHITLSRWLRDYLYIPLGGNRNSKTRTHMNLITVMALGGLWHGAGWTFLIWGLIHGSGLVGERMIGAHKVSGWRLPTWWLLSQLIIVIAWVYFRAPSLHFADKYVQEMFSFSHYKWHDLQLLGAGIFALPLIMHHFIPNLMQRMKRSHLMPLLGSSTGVMLAASFIVQSPPAVFIYFAF